MTLSSLDDYAAKGIEGKFGILDIELEGDQKPLKASFIENGKKQKVLDEFKIIKNWATNSKFSFFFFFYLIMSIFYPSIVF